MKTTVQNENTCKVGKGFLYEENTWMKNTFYKAYSLLYIKTFYMYDISL